MCTLHFGLVEGMHAPHFGLVEGMCTPHFGVFGGIYVPAHFYVVDLLLSGFAEFIITKIKKNIIKSVSIKKINAIYILQVTF